MLLNSHVVSGDPVNGGDSVNPGAIALFDLSQGVTIVATVNYDSATNYTNELDLGIGDEFGVSIFAVLQTQAGALNANKLTIQKEVTGGDNGPVRHVDFSPLVDHQITVVLVPPVFQILIDGVLVYTDTCPDLAAVDAPQLLLFNTNADLTHAPWKLKSILISGQPAPPPSLTITLVEFDGGAFLVHFDGPVDATDFLPTQLTGDGASGPFDGNGGPTNQDGPTQVDWLLGAGSPGEPATVTITGHPELTNPTDFPVTFL